MTAIPPDPEDGFSADALVDKAVGKAADSALSRWWKGFDDEQKWAWRGIAFALALGPLGQGLLAAIKVLYGNQAPSSQQVQALWWLAVITLPVFIAAAIIGYNVRKLNPGVFVGAAAAAIGGVYLLTQLDVPKNLGKVYCYASTRGGELVYEHACRKFDTYGFFNSAQHTRGSGPAWAAQIFAEAYAYTADARGWVMAVCGVIGGFCAGYLAMRSSA